MSIFYCILLNILIFLFLNALLIFLWTLICLCIIIERQISISCLLLSFFLFSLNFSQLFNSQFLFNNHNILIQSIEKMFSHLLKRFLIKFIINSIIIEVSVKRCLQSITVRYIKFLSKHNSCCFTLSVLVFELAWVESKLRSFFG